MKILYFLSDFSIIVHLFFIPDSRAEHRPEHVRNALNFPPFLHWTKIFRGVGNAPVYATDLSYSESNFVKLIFKTCYYLITELMDHHKLFLSQKEISTILLNLLIKI